jgi:hypothetical protein
LRSRDDDHKNRVELLQLVDHLRQTIEWHFDVSGSNLMSTGDRLYLTLAALSPFVVIGSRSEFSLLTVGLQFAS